MKARSAGLSLGRSPRRRSTQRAAHEPRDRASARTEPRFDTLQGSRSLLVALDHLALLSGLKPERFPAAAVRWHGRLELEAPTPTLAESQYALAALVMLG